MRKLFFYITTMSFIKMFWSDTNKLFNVALFFIEKAKKDWKRINHKKLQKLTYYAQSWNLAINDKRLFNNNIEAWVNWPVAPELYREYKNYWYMDITTSKSCDLNIFDKDEIKILEWVYKIYWNYDSDYLVWLTHNETPWLSARWELDNSVASNNIISLDIMKNFYKAQLKK